MEFSVFLFMIPRVYNKIRCYFQCTNLSLKELRDVLAFVRSFLRHNYDCLSFQMFYTWGSMVTIVYLYSVGHHCIWLLYLALIGGGTRWSDLFVQTFFCHNNNFMPLQDVLHLRLHVYYSIFVQCISSLYMTVLPFFLKRRNRRKWFALTFWSVL